MPKTPTEEKHSWQDELRDLMRGVGGAAIIGVPLVYTMEVWQAATTLGTSEIFRLLCFGFAACIGYNFFSGFRKGTSLAGAVRDAVESLGIGVALSAVLMVTLGIIDGQTPLTDAACKVALEAVPLAIGASVANTQFDGGESNREEPEEKDAEAQQVESKNALVREVGIAAAGSLIFAASIAPTEEVALIAHRLTPLNVAAVALFSLLLSYGMIFVADFTGSETRQKTSGILQSPLGETTLCYAVALGIAFFAVCFFHGGQVLTSPFSTVALTVSMGLPAAIGGAAGRLIV